MLKAIFFDAAGTLIRLTKSVGWHYALVGAQQDLDLDAAELDAAFRAVWKEMPVRPATGRPRPDDDKGWWRELVRRVLAQTGARTSAPERAAFFEAAYGHFGQAGVWELFPEVREVLETLALRYELSVVSNFDRRLHSVFHHLSIAEYFRHIFLSSELGADKPDPRIFQSALHRAGFSPNDVLHAGDDPARDWAAASAAGLQIFRLERPRNSLRDLLHDLAPDGEPS